MSIRFKKLLVDLSIDQIVILLNTTLNSFYSITFFFQLTYWSVNMRSFSNKTENLSNLKKKSTMPQHKPIELLNILVELK